MTTIRRNQENFQNCQQKVRETLDAVRAKYGVKGKFTDADFYRICEAENITLLNAGDARALELEEIGINQSQLAAHIGVLPKTINEICNGKRGISAAMAWKLSKAVGASPLFWMNLQTNWELSQIDETAFSQLERLAA